MQYQLADSRATPPTPSSYWVLPNRLLAGAYQGHRVPAEHQARIHALVDAGIRHFLNLMEEHETNYSGETFAPYLPIASARVPTVHMIRHSIRDLSVPTPPTTMTAILDAIDESLASDQPTYVHCWGGVGRTGTVIGCWLLRRGLPTWKSPLLVHSCRGLSAFGTLDLIRSVSIPNATNRLCRVL